MAHLTLLGVGHSESIRHWNNNAMVTAGQRRLLIDAGYTIKFALNDIGLTFADIDAIFLSHVHADHCFGLERMAYECRFQHQFKPVLYLPPNLYSELWNESLKGVMGKTGEGPASLEDYFDLVHLDHDTFRFHGVSLKYFENRHTPGKSSYGLCLNEKLLYSGDTKAIPEIVGRFKPETILHDCTLADSNPVHATISELVTSYSASVRQRMYLMSYEDCFENYRHELEREFAGLASQGQEFEL